MSPATSVDFETLLSLNPLCLSDVHWDSVHSNDNMHYFNGIVVFFCRLDYLQKLAPCLASSPAMWVIVLFFLSFKKKKSFSDYVFV